MMGEYQKYLERPPVRGRIRSIRPDLVVAHVEVETDYGIISTVVSTQALHELELTVGGDVLVRISAAETRLVGTRFSPRPA